uniref:Putative secreted protein n=1 Tax=Anopheles darlingi TaxID=43151 RepID=A0A2M4DRG3_ANODA
MEPFLQWHLLRSLVVVFSAETGRLDATVESGDQGNVYEAQVRSVQPLVGRVCDLRTVLRICDPELR